MDNFFPMNAPATGDAQHTGPWVYVVIKGGVVEQVSFSLEAANQYLSDLMLASQGLGPWTPVETIPDDGWFMKGPGGCQVICTRHPILP